MSNIKLTLKNSQKLLPFCQSGEIWSNFIRVLYNKNAEPQISLHFALRRTIHEEINSDFATEERIRPKYL